jgi:NAD(P)-dependent dehydrogenase (short-subunit alcohol dehydrogenase family)
MDTELLRDRVAIVAGGGRGNGAAISLTLGGAGARVAVVDVEQSRADHTVDEIEQAGGEAIAVVADVRSPVGVRQIVDRTATTFGSIDVLVNNAGGMNQYAPFRALGDWTDDAWDDIVNRNLRYVFLMCRAVIPVMQATGGSIVNISSLSGVVSSPWHAGYGAAKAGIVNLTRSIAVEYGPSGIRANAVAPGAILTPATEDKLTPEEVEKYTTMVPVSRVGRPQDIANAVLFFASDLSAYVSGQLLVVDGAATCKYPLDLPTP